MSFSSELFKRLITMEGAIPSEDLIQERDRLRAPHSPLEESPGLKKVLEAINEEFARVLPSRPTLKLRLTSTDSASLIEALVPHYEHGSDVTLPANRHGTGLLSLQSLVLLLELGRVRRDNRQNFILALEEPELHLPPGLQRRVLHRASTVAGQVICTTHSARVASFFQSAQIVVLSNNDGVLRAPHLLETKLTAVAPNALRKLFIDNRQYLVEALMHEKILIPEGRGDFELLRLLNDAVETTQFFQSRWEYALLFGAAVGLVPTHDAAIVETTRAVARVREGLLVVVDGDSAGNSYVKSLVQQDPPPEAVVQWIDGWSIEDVLGWVLEPAGSEVVQRVNASFGHTPATDCSFENADECGRAQERLLGIRGYSGGH